MTNKEIADIEKDLDVQKNYIVVSDNGERGKIYSYQYNGITYYLQDATKYVVDDYDEFTGSVELSHYEGLGYKNIIGYEEDVDGIDLTWMSPFDSIDLMANENLKSISLSSENLNEFYCKNLNGEINFDIHLVPNLKSFSNLRRLIPFIKKTNSNVSITSSNNDLFDSLVEKLFRINNINVTFNSVTLDSHFTK